MVYSEQGKKKDHSREVFRTQLNIYDEAFVQKAVNYLC